jgi:hypothetical protein
VSSPFDTPRHYDSCFISHSSQDAGFAEKLAEKLTNAGVSVWYDNRKIQGGRPLETQFTRAIRASDRLLLVVSQSSLARSWVAFEVGQAMKRAVELSDREEARKSLLFPIRLLSMERIDSILRSKATFPEFQVLKNFPLLDFTRWKEPGWFDSACEMLIRDLRKDE